MKYGFKEYCKMPFKQPWYGEEAVNMRNDWKEERKDMIDCIELLIKAIPEGWMVPLLYDDIVAQVKDTFPELLYRDKLEEARSFIREYKRTTSVCPVCRKRVYKELMIRYHVPHLYREQRMCHNCYHTNPK